MPASHSSGPTAAAGPATEPLHFDLALRAIVEGTAAATSGTEFLRSLVRQLASALGVRYAFVTESLGSPPSRKRLLAFWTGTGFAPSQTHALAGTPCEQVLHSGTSCLYPSAVRARFPGDAMLAERGCESYMAVPLCDAQSAVIGHLAVMHDGVLSDGERRMAMLQIFAAHAAAEIQRQRAEDELRASEEHFRSLIENSSEAIGVLDREGRIRYASTSYERMSGWSRAQLVGHSLIGFIHPEDLPRAQTGLERLLQSAEGVVTVELRARHGDGSWLLLESLAKLRPDGSIVVNSRDITSQRRTEEELRRLNAELEARVAARTAELRAALERSQKLASLIEATSDYVGIADLEGRSLYVNRNGRRMVGKPESAEDEAPWHVASCHPAGEQARLAEAFAAVSRGETWSGETLLLHQNGETIPVSAVMFGLRDMDGVISSAGAIFRNITEQKRMEGELRAAKEAAEAASRAKSTFLANMSHELRTPMNAVIGMTGLLLQTQQTAKQREFVETIREAGDSLLTVINDILDFSKIEAGRMELECQPLDLRGCIESALDLLAPRAAEKGVDLACLMEPEVPAGVYGDITRLRQILVNLLGNAVKFTQAGEVLVSVKLAPPQAAATGELLLQLSVRDTGIGLPPDRIGQLFQSFTQLDPSTTRQFGGTGLGLAISRRLAEMMGGRMWAESAGLGQGATFHFTFATRAAAAPGRQHLQRPRPELSGKRILIVDDNATNRRILYLQLQSWGMMARETASAAEALAALRSGERFDAAILDMHLSRHRHDDGPDGLGLARTIRHEAAAGRAACRLPLIMLTSVSQSVSESVANGEFAAQLTKPVKPSQLYDVLVGVFAEGYRRTAPPAPPADGGTLLAQQLPLRILVAEDVAVNQKFVLMALEDMGYRADVAGNGLEAVAAVRRQPYDVVLMDVQMPEMDGLEATGQIRRLWSEHAIEMPSPRRPRIVAMTANALHGDREVCLNAGMDDYVSKPVYLEELRAALERCGEYVRITGAAAAGGADETVDRAALARLLQRRNAAGLIEQFLAEARELLDRLQLAARSGEAGAMRAAAHGLKGCSGYVGARQLAALCAAVEAAARSDQVDVVRAQLPAVEQAFAGTRSVLLAAIAASGARP